MVNGVLEISKLKLRDTCIEVNCFACISAVFVNDLFKTECIAVSVESKRKRVCTKVLFGGKRLSKSLLNKRFAIKMLISKTCTNNHKNDNCAINERLFVPLNKMLGVV